VDDLCIVEDPGEINGDHEQKDDEGHQDRQFDRGGCPT
jgi:hypothetical protein